MNARVPQFHIDSEKFLADEKRVTWHDGALWHLRYKRDRAADTVPDWELLREQAAGIKAHVLDHIPSLLSQFITNAEAAMRQADHAYSTSMLTLTRGVPWYRHLWLSGLECFRGG